MSILKSNNGWDSFLLSIFHLFPLFFLSNLIHEIITERYVKNGAGMGIRIVIEAKKRAAMIASITLGLGAPGTILFLFLPSYVTVIFPLIVIFFVPSMMFLILTLEKDKDRA